MAEFSEANYILNNDKLKKGEREKMVNDLIPDGYVMHPKSDRNVALYTNKTEKHAVISHRGTDFSNNKDLTSDLLFSLGMENHGDEFKKRTSKTEKLLKEVNGDYAVTLQGHSYGGASALNSAVKSHKIRGRVDEINLYNPLTAGDHSNQKIHKKKGQTDDNEKYILDGLTTTYRTKNDLVSAKPTEYGDIKTFKQKAKYKTVPKVFQSIFRSVDQLDAHGLHNFIN
jgi:hypothetical protein